MVQILSLNITYELINDHIEFWHMHLYADDIEFCHIHLYAFPFSNKLNETQTNKYKMIEIDIKDEATHPAALFRARDPVLTISPLARTTWKANNTLNKV